jgi:hypothetical protein
LALPPRGDGIHADAVAQQGATALAPGWVDADHRDTQGIVLIEPQAANEFIGERRLACAASACDTQNWYFFSSCLRMYIMG